MKLLETLYKYLRIAKNFLIKKLNDWFCVTTSKKLKITGIVVAAITFLTVIIFVNSFTSLEFKQKWLMLAVALVSPLVIGFSIAYTVRLKNPKADKIYQLITLFIMPIFAMTMTEALNGVYIFKMRALGFLANYLVILIFYCLLFALTGSLRVTFLSINTVIYGLALAHAYVMVFRGTVFQPMDFFSITTAMGVANTYDFSPTATMMLATFLFIFLTNYAIKTNTPKYTIPTKIISRALTGTFSTVVLIIFFFTSTFANLGVKPDFWKQERGYNRYGFVFNFFCNTKYLWMSPPDGYDSSKIEEHISNVVDGKDEYEYSDDLPNIICIMNESLSDLNVLGDFKTNEDYMPFMRSLTENTIKGNCYVPVVGAGTSNTEFEFLTGHSTAFLPSGSNAYMLYIKNPIATLVSTLKAQRFSSFALHPYYAGGWKRTDVYGNFGFDNFISLEDIFEPSVLGLYRENSDDPDYVQEIVNQYYPQNTNMLLRQYISDDYNYDILIKDFENRNKEVPYFAFNVTMQNHGGYTTSALNFEEKIYTTSLSKSYPKVNKYLSLVKASDDAFKELIEYFTNVEEPTIICMFGDHHPTVEKEFVAEVLGVKSLSDVTIEQEQARHATPFFIWANYDIEEQYIEKLSVNYLSSLVLQTAGARLTEYNKYLLKLAKTLPVINTVGYIDNQGIYYNWDQESPYTEILEGYKKIQYNNIFDQENVNRKTFYIDKYIPKATNLEEEY